MSLLISLCRQLTSMKHRGALLIVALSIVGAIAAAIWVTVKMYNSEAADEQHIRCPTGYRTDGNGQRCIRSGWTPGG